ncbi:hypothetical protein EMIT048CA2_50089 [Pseudomonas chlororaphis]
MRIFGFFFACRKEGAGLEGVQGTTGASKVYVLVMVLPRFFRPIPPMALQDLVASAFSPS